MDEIKEEKTAISNNVLKKLELLSKEEASQKSLLIEMRLLDFANFMEAHVVLLYLSRSGDVGTQRIINHCFANNKIAVMPYFDGKKKKTSLMKVGNLKTDIISTDLGPAPDPSRCRMVPVDSIEIALIPGLVFDEKGARIGLGDGYYEKLIPRLPATTRKVALAYEDQIIPQVPKGAIDKYVDIIITEERIIYKI